MNRIKPDMEKLKISKTPMEQYNALYPNYKFIGFWRFYKTSEEYINSDNPIRRAQQIKELENELKDNLPWPQDFIDENQNPVILNKIVKYLDGGETGLRYMGFSVCRICKKLLGTCDITDGLYVWPDKLSHYLIQHKVKLPDEFVNYVLEKLKE